MRPHSLLFWTALALAGCGDDGTEPEDDTTDCTTLAKASVLVRVFDETGEPFALTQGEVQWRVDGGDWQMADCWPDDGGPCTQWIAGWEVAGEIEARAYHFEEDPSDPCCDFESVPQGSTTVVMDANDCHVEQGFIDLTVVRTDQVCLDTGC